MSLNISDVEIDISQGSDCNRFTFLFSDTLFKNNIQVHKFQTFILTIEGTEINITNEVITAPNTGVIDCSTNSTTVQGSGTKFLTEYADSKYILIEGYVYEIKNILADTQLSLKTTFKQATISTANHSNVLSTIVIPIDIPDGYKDVELKVLSEYYNNPEETIITDIKIFSCHAECCLDQMMLMLPEKMCDGCNFEDFVFDLMTLQSLIEGAQRSNCCSTKIAANKIFKTITQICSFNNCASC
jgi:hypothetical protein